MPANIRRFPIALGITALAAVPILAVAARTTTPPVVSSAKNGCPAGRLAQLQSGKRSCVAAARLSASRRPAPLLGAFMKGVLSRPVPPPPRPNARLLKPVSPRLIKRIGAAVDYNQAGFIAEATDALKTGATENAAAPGSVTVTRPGVTIVAPGVGSATYTPSVTRRSDGSVGGRLEQSFSKVDGTSGHLDQSFEARRAGEGVAFGAGLDVLLKEADGSSTGGSSELSDLSAAPSPSCPEVDGSFRFDKKLRLRWNSVRKYGSERARLGVVREAETLEVSMSATPRLDGEARLQPFAFKVGFETDHVWTGQSLAFSGYSRRYVGSGSLSGTMDPTTGTVTGGSLVNDSRAPGFSSKDAAELRTAVRSAVVQGLKDQEGRLLADARTVETRARTGGCTRLNLDPPSPGTLAPQARSSLTAVLITRTLKGPSVPNVVWTATAAKGSVSPGTASVEKATFAVVGASEGPETANVKVRAASAAGISEATWTANGSTSQRQLPAAYEGTIKRVSTYGSGASGTLEWAASLRFELRPRSSRTAPLGLYDIVRGTATGVISLAVPAGCTTQGSVTLTLPDSSIVTGVPLTVIDGRVPGYNWLPGFVLDAAKPVYYNFFIAGDTPKIPITRVCPSPTGTTTGVEYPLDLGEAGINIGWSPTAGDVRQSADTNVLVGSRVTPQLNGGATTVTWSLQEAP